MRTRIHPVSSGLVPPESGAWVDVLTAILWRPSPVVTSQHHNLPVQSQIWSDHPSSQHLAYFVSFSWCPSLVPYSQGRATVRHILLPTSPRIYIYNSIWTSCCQIPSWLLCQEHVGSLWLTLLKAKPTSSCQWWSRQWLSYSQRDGPEGNVQILVLCPCPLTLALLGMRSVMSGAAWAHAGMLVASLHSARHRGGTP